MKFWLQRSKQVIECMALSNMSFNLRPWSR